MIQRTRSIGLLVISLAALGVAALASAALAPDWFANDKTKPAVVVYYSAGRDNISIANNANAMHTDGTVSPRADQVFLVLPSKNVLLSTPFWPKDKLEWVYAGATVTVSVKDVEYAPGKLFTGQVVVDKAANAINWSYTMDGHAGAGSKSFGTLKAINLYTPPVP